MKTTYFGGGSGGGGAVASVFGRVGVVVALFGDYSGSLIDNDSGVAGTSVSDALDTLGAAIVSVSTLAVGGQLSGNLPNPNVIGIRETSGPTNLTFGAISNNQVLQRVGATVVGVTPITGPLDPGDNGKIPRASAGDFIYISGSASDALIWNGAQWAGAKIVDASIDNAAAIAGTKISPDFGSQNVVTTGNFVITGGASYIKTSTPILQLGLDPGSGAGSAAAAGNIRVGSLFSIIGLNGTNVTDKNIIEWNAGSTTLTIGSTTSFNILYQASASHIFGVGGVTKFSVVSSEVRPAVPIAWVAGAVASISQATMAVAGTATNLTITGQGNSDSGVTVGGSVIISGGPCTNPGAVTSQQAGSVWIQGGSFSGSSGTRTHGSAGVRDSAGTKVIEVVFVTESRLGFFNVTPVAKQSLTNTTGGVSANTLVDVDTAGVSDVAKVNANFASIWTKINNYGLWA